MSKRGNGEGTIYYSEKLNKWVGQFTAGRKDNGKLNRKSVYGNTRKEVKEKMTKALADVQNNTYIEKNNIKLYDLSKEIVKDKKNSNQISASTYNRAKYTLKIIEKSNLGQTAIQDITAKDIKDFLNDNTNYSNSTLKKIYQLLGQTFRRAIERNYIVRNPITYEEARKPKSSKISSKVEALTIDEEKKLISLLSNELSLYRPIVLLMLFTGMRVGEVLALKWNCLTENYINVKQSLTKDEDGKVILGDMVKTENSLRQIPTNNIINSIIDEIPKTSQTNLLFPNITPRMVHKFLSNFNATNCIKNNIHPHMLRHTFATRCIEAGMPANVLSKVMGHADIRTTLEVYCDVFDNYEKQHANRTYDYLNQNQLLLSQINEDTIPAEQLNKIMESIKKMYEKQDDKLIKILKLVA